MCVCVCISESVFLPAQAHSVAQLPQRCRFLFVEFILFGILYQFQSLEKHKFANFKYLRSLLVFH